MKLLPITFITLILLGCGENQEIAERARVAERLKTMEKQVLEEQRQPKNPAPEDPAPEVSACLSDIDSFKKEAEVAKKKSDHKRVVEVLKPCYGVMTDGDAIALYLRSLDLRTKQEKRKAGVHLGMTKEDVISSSWGRPSKINKTHTSEGTREQWIYNNNYLYFENGVLTAIQN